MTAPPLLPPDSTVCPVSQLTARLLTWLWPGRLALGKLAVLDGDPGVGKSLVTLDLCARLSTGRAFPDGSPGPEASGALVLNGEDDAQDTIRPRLQALGADLDRVFVPHEVRDGAEGGFLFPARTNRLDDALTRTGARLVVIDPIVAFLDPNIFESSNQSIRSALAPLAWVAEKHGCAVLLVRHLNKRGGSRSVYRGGGSMGILGACRSGWLIARDPILKERCVLAQVKNNLGPPQPSLAYGVTCHEGTPPTLTWMGTTPWTADQLLASRVDAGHATPRDRAKDFLTSFLADGPRTSREVWAAVQEEELSVRTVERAKEELAIRSVRVWVDRQPVSYWMLEGQQLPTVAAPEEEPADLEPWLKPLREQYPPSTPLDEL